MGLESALRGRRVRGYALGTSAIALGIALGSPAAAQCAPDPTVANGTTNCAGTDGDGVTVSTRNSQVAVAAGAIVRPGNADAGITVQALDASLRIAGLVEGGAKPGILLLAGAPRTVPCDPYAGASPIYCVPGSPQTVYSDASAAISVAAGGTVTGGNAILLRRAPGSFSGSASATITNAGTITGTAGEAILASDTGVFGGLSITNNATGTITGGIAGPVSYLTNAGRIDGAGRAAVASSRSGFGVVNSGTIVSRGAGATLSGTGYLSVSNAAGATIGGSTTAIRTTGTLMLTNSGTINGSVVSTAGAGQASTIDTRAGTINGDLLLGAGDDMLRARYDVATGRVSSITGTVDGGAGTRRGRSSPPLPSFGAGLPATSRQRCGYRPSNLVQHIEKTSLRCYLRRSNDTGYRAWLTPSWRKPLPVFPN